MALKLHGVLPGIAVGGAAHRSKAQVQQRPVPPAEPSVAELPVRLLRKAGSPLRGEKLLGHPDHALSREADDADGADLVSGRNGSNGV